MVDRDTAPDGDSTDSHPVPVCRFSFEDGVAVVSRTNRAFDDRFGDDCADEAVTDVFESLFSPTKDLSAALDSGENVAVRTRAKNEDAAQKNSNHQDSDSKPTKYVVDVSAPSEGIDGYLVFADATDVTARCCEHDSETNTGSDQQTANGQPADGLAVDHVASVVSHDLRNPLDVARARLRAGREFGEEEHFEHVEQAHDRMERIIQDVLTLARGEDVVDPDETVDLAGVAEKAWETVETGGATLSIDRPLPTVRADADRVSRLFENLFRNAVEHGSTNPRSHSHEDAVEHGSTSPHSPTREDAVEQGSTRGEQHGAVTVTVGPTESGDGFYVADNGPGIPADERQHVFEPGYSSDDHGTGLGLSIVARIADLHGWSVDVSESDTGGAQFEIRGLTNP